MNVRTITMELVAVALIASAGGVFAAEQSSQESPDAGPGQAVMSPASNTEITYLGGGVYVTNDRMSALRDASAAPETAPASEEGAVIEVLSAPVVIESDVPNRDPTLDQLMQKFRTALGQPPTTNVSERQLANGAIEVTTSLGRFCTTPPPSSIQSGLGGDIMLTAPCAVF